MDASSINGRREYKVERKTISDGLLQYLIFCLAFGYLKEQNPLEFISDSVRYFSELYEDKKLPTPVLWETKIQINRCAFNAGSFCKIFLSSLLLMSYLYFYF